MSFDESPLGFFPTPYPDEIFYSVLCRYHIRSGNPAFVSTAKTIWGKKNSTNLYLPQSLGKVSLRIPSETGLTAEFFAVNNTIYPFLKPFLTKERGPQVLELLKSESHSEFMAYQLCGLPRSKSPKWQYLRYCEDCWSEDIRLYGEPYWHRLHLLPGIFICPVHGKPILNSTVFLKDIQSKFHTASFNVATKESAPYFNDSITENLMAVALDALWIMQNGNTLPFSETMIEIYDQLLRVKGFRSLSGRKNKSLLLDKEICAYYGQELLGVLCVHSQGVVPWSERVMNKRNSLLYPVYYLLLMRFLAGSAEDFFTNQHGVAHPYFKNKMEADGFSVLVVNTSKFKVITMSTKKTDANDAATLAFYLSKGMLPESHLCDQTSEEIRRMLKTRSILVSNTVKIKNQIHGMLLGYGIETKGAQFQSKKKRQKLIDGLADHDFSQFTASSLEVTLNILDDIYAQVKRIEEEICKMTKENEDVELLVTMPGIGFVGATTIASYTANIERFDGDFKRFSSYLGLVPSVHNSADSIHMGHITKRGPQELRTAFVQVAMGIIRQPKNTSEWKLMKDYQTMKVSKGSGRAIIALTRKVARIVFAMLNNREPFNPELIKKAYVA